MGVFSSHGRFFLHIGATEGRRILHLFLTVFNSDALDSVCFDSFQNKCLVSEHSKILFIHSYKFMVICREETEYACCILAGPGL